MPVEEKAAEQKPADEKTAEQKPAEQKPAEQKPAAEKPGETKPGEKAPEHKEPASKEGEEKPQPKAPEKYALTTPDGAKDWLDASDLQQIEGIARAKGWTNEEAQTALDEHADRLAAQSLAFRVETEADPIYGGEHLAETQRLAMAALDKVRPATTPDGKALRGLLAKTGYGNNRHIVTFLADIGKSMAEDGHVAGAGSGSSARSAEEVLYGDTTKKT